MLQKTMAHSATIAEKNAAIKKMKQEAAGFHGIYFEMVDEVDHAHKYAQGMVKERFNLKNAPKQQSVLL